MSGFAYYPERSDKIMEMLARKGKLSVTEIVESFSVSEATARRDLNFLAREGKIRRYYGGAILCQEAAPEGPILQRTMEQQEEKERIGRAAANLVEDGETIFLGSGTTVLQVAKNLAGRLLTVITNSLPIINLMAYWPEITLTALGGQFRSSERSFIGHITDKFIQDLRANKVIIGIRAISLEHGLTNDYMPETITDRAILGMGQKVIIVADHTKFDRVSTVHVAPVEVAGTIVTDTLVPAGYIEELRSRDVELIVV